MMNTQMIDAFCSIDDESKNLLERVVKGLGLSARAYHRILKISRTIEDMEGSESIFKNHIAEAIQYRREG